MHFKGFRDLAALLSYTHTNLVNRMQKLTAALLLDETRLLLDSLLLTPDKETLRLAVVGGGPGYEVSENAHASVSRAI